MSLRGNEGFLIDANRLCDHILLDKNDDREVHINVALLGASCLRTGIGCMSCQSLTPVDLEFIQDVAGAPRGFVEGGRKHD